MRLLAAVLATIPLAAACRAAEAPTVILPVETRPGAIPAATTDLGYEVTVTRLRAAIADVELTVGGEAHAREGDVVFHPGHAAGGEVTGELPGDHVLVWDGAAHRLGDATLIAGAYASASWAWRQARPGEPAPGDPLAGHAFHVEGVARRGGADHPFDARLVVEPDRRLDGAVFVATIAAGATAPLQVTFVPTEPSSGATAFDGVDFAALPAPDGVAAIRPGEAAHNVLRRRLQAHDHYAISTTNQE